MRGRREPYRFGSPCKVLEGSAGSRGGLEQEGEVRLARGLEVLSSEARLGVVATRGLSQTYWWAVADPRMLVGLLGLRAMCVLKFWAERGP